MSGCSMTRIHPVILCAAIIVLVIAAGCTSGTNNPPALMTTTPASTATPEPTAAVTTAATQPGPAGTQASGTCTANINTDPANCGGCGYACPANALCSQGQCFC